MATPEEVFDRWKAGLGSPDDLSTDGEKIYSDKVKAFGDELLFITRRSGGEVPWEKIGRLNGW